MGYILTRYLENLGHKTKRVYKIDALIIIFKIIL